mmetsp:Transcript_25687/g.61007  ORF Transcript_25687/g.61007 Transcript_25687/m.61007 type:complete len:130 (-) Transcript_25687:2-391(-)
MNFEDRTGSSVTSNVFSSVCDCQFHMCTVPLYKLQSIHGSSGCKSTLLTRSERDVSFLRMFNRSGILSFAFQMRASSPLAAGSLPQRFRLYRHACPFTGLYNQRIRRQKAAAVREKAAATAPAQQQRKG